MNQFTSPSNPGLLNLSNTAVTLSVEPRSITASLTSARQTSFGSGFEKCRSFLKTKSAESFGAICAHSPSQPKRMNSSFSRSRTTRETCGVVLTPYCFNVGSPKDRETGWEKRFSIFFYIYLIFYLVKC